MCTWFDNHVGAIGCKVSSAVGQWETIDVSTASLCGKDNLFVISRRPWCSTCQFVRCEIKCIGVSNIIVRGNFYLCQIAITKNGVARVRLEDEIGSLMIELEAECFSADGSCCVSRSTVARLTQVGCSIWYSLRLGS